MDISDIVKDIRYVDELVRALISDFYEWFHTMFTESIKNLTKNGKLVVSIQFMYTSYNRMFMSGGLSSVLGSFASNYDNYKGSSIIPGFVDLTSELKNTSDVRSYVASYTERMAKLFESDIHSVIIDDFNGEYLIGVQYNKEVGKTLHTVVNVPSRCSHSCALRSMVEVANTMVNIH